MSVSYYLACHECKKLLHVAQDGVGGFGFYSGEPNCMEAVREMLGECLLLHGDRLGFVREQSDEWETYEQVDWDAK